MCESLCLSKKVGTCSSFIIINIININIIINILSVTYLCFLYTDSTTIDSQRDVGHCIDYVETLLSMSVKSVVGMFLKTWHLKL